MSKKLSHTDSGGKANMVDVGQKPDLERTAVATGHIELNPETIKLVKENAMKKGDVFTVAEIAGTIAAKKTSELIPLCHPLLINKAGVSCSFTDNGIEVTATTNCTGKTGVEMEALTAVSVALLTIYDMCKAVDKNMVISRIKLIEKHKSPKIL